MNTQRQLTHATPRSIRLLVNVLTMSLVASLLSVAVGPSSLAAQDIGGQDVAGSETTVQLGFSDWTPIDFRTWSRQGSTLQRFAVSDDGTELRSTNNLVSFNLTTQYVSPEEFESVEVRGTVAVETTSDDDAFGFAFGYQQPFADDNVVTDRDFVTVSWKQRQQSFDGIFLPEGLQLVDYAGDGEREVIAENAGVGQGWEDLVEYDFRGVYTPSRIEIYIDDELRLEADGSFEPGAIGAYLVSQADVVWRDFEYRIPLEIVLNVGAGDDQLVPEGSVVNLAGVGSAEDLNGAETYLWEQVSGRAVNLSSTSVLDPTFNAVEDGIYTFRLTETVAGTSTSDLMTVTVENQAPEIEIGAEVSPTDGAVLLSTSFTDPGILDGHTVSVDWGDGSSQEPVPVSVQGAGWGAVALSHVYATAGDYVAVITLVDDDGGEAVVEAPLTIARGGNPAAVPGFSLWADSASNAEALRIAGRNITAEGRVNSNDGVLANNDGVQISNEEDSFTAVGPVVETGRNHDAVPTVADVAAAPMEFDIANYRPGGLSTVAAGDLYVDLTDTCSVSPDAVWAPTGPLASGLYWSPCAVDLGGTGLSFDGPVTIVSETVIEVSGREHNFPPAFADSLSLLANGAGTAVKVSGDSSEFAGAVVAATGELLVTGIDHRFTCGAFGANVLVTGQGHTFDQSSCEASEAGVPNSVPIDASPVVIPNLVTAVSATEAVVSPGETVTFTASVSNVGALIAVPAQLQVTNSGAAAATVNAASVDLEILDPTTDQWRSLIVGGSANGIVALADGVSTTGQLVGTTIDPQRTANVGLEALFDLGVDELDELFDPAVASDVRLRISLDSDQPVETLLRIDDELAAELRDASADATDVVASVDAPPGTSIPLNAAVIAPGEVVTTSVDVVVPAVEPQAPDETNEAFASRLEALDSSFVSAGVSGSAGATVGTVPLAGTFAATQIDLPVVRFSFESPPSVRAGDDVVSTIEVTNTGSVLADLSALATETELGDLVIVGLPSELAPGESATATVIAAVAADRTANLVKSIELTFSGAGLAATLTPETQSVDVLVDSALEVTKTVSEVNSDLANIEYAIEIRNTGDDVITGITLTDTPTPVFALVDGSLSITQGSVDVVEGTMTADIGDLGAAESAVILYSIDFESTADSVSTIVNQAVVSSNELPDVLSDDPSVDGVADPTVFSVRTFIIGGDGTVGWFGDPTLQGGIFTPEDGAVVTEPTDIGIDFSLIEVPEGRTIETWRLVATPYGDPEAASVVIADGTGTPPNDLGTFDPSVVGNGPYALTLEMIDSTDQLGVVQSSVIVEGGLKLGRYSITYEDMFVPVGGVPIQVLRTYDTLDRTQSDDFGFGWDLEVANFQIASNGPLGFGGWEQIGCGTSAGLVFAEICYQTSRSHFVTVTWPNGQVESFDFTPDGTSTFFASQVIAAYAPKDERTTSTLSPVPGDSNAFYESAGGIINAGGFGGGGVYDPQRWVLTDRFGTQYILDADDGLVEAIDRNGNSIRVTDDGVFSSDGPSITFDRDTEGRITEATGPDGESVVYTYDAAGDLTAATDQNGNVYGYGYDDGHYLSEIDDPGNAQRVLTYDDDGRLTSLTDAEGNTTQVDIDVDARTEIVTDPDGNLTTISQFDERGNATQVSEVYDGTSNVSSFTYDDLDEITSRTDPEGNTWAASYDEERNLTQFVDAVGNTSNFSYDEFGFPLTVTDADGQTTSFSYDNRGNISSITDTRNGTQAFTYDGDGNQTSRTDQVGRTWEWSYNSASRLALATDPRGNTTSYSYDGQGRLTAMTAADGGTTSYGYDGVGNLTTMTDPLGRTTSYQYSDRDALTAVTDPSGATTGYTYDDNDRVVSRTDATSRTWTYTYAFDRLASETAPDGGTTTYAYDGAGRVDTMVDPLGRTTTYAYDAAHRRTSVTTPVGTTTTGYDGNGRVTASTNAEAETTAYSYDALGRLDTLTDPIGRGTSYGYDPTGNRTSVTNAENETTNWVFNLAGELTAVTNAESETTSYTYDAAGNLASVTDPLSRTTTYGYDAVNRRTTTTLPSGDAATTVFDTAGQVTESTSAAGVTATYSYDPRGLVESITDGLGNTQASAYDPAGRLLTATDARGNNTTFSYDPNGRIQSETDPEGGFVTMGYDLAGQRTSLTDPNGATRTWTYDNGGRMTAATDAEGRTTTYGYDDVGRQTSMTDARGITVSNTFDNAGQLTSQVSPDETRSFTYDDAGRNTAWTDITGNTTVTYDDVGRMTEIVTPAGAVSYGYNAAGEQTSMTQPEGDLTYGYDINGFMDSVTDWRGDTITYTNDADGRMLSVDRSNGVDTAYGYDTAGRLTGIDHSSAAGVIDAYAYTLDANGNRTAVTSPQSGTETYVLDGLNRITEASYGDGTSETFTYDAAGNRTSHTTIDGDTIGYTVDNTGQLISDTTGTTYSYDAAGNLTATSDGDSYTYDAYGRTVEVTAEGVTQTYGYDASDVRVTVDGDTQLWDRNGLPTLISTGAGENYVHTPSGITRDGDQWLLADAVGSVRTSVDDTGATTGTSSFTVFGEQLTGNGTFGYAGEQQDPTGLLHLRARQYNPAVGRFTTVDPVQPGAPGNTGYNLYSYSGNNPTTWTDPTGQTTAVEGGLIDTNVAGRAAAGSSATAAEIAYLNSIYYGASAATSGSAIAAANAAATTTIGSSLFAKFVIGTLALGAGGLLLGGDTPPPEPQPELQNPPIVTEPEADAGTPEPEPQLATDGAGARDGGGLCNNYGDGFTRRGVRRTTNEDWAAAQDVWDQAGLNGILSSGNRWRIANSLSPRVDANWVEWFPEHAPAIGETIIMHHVDGNRITVPLPSSFHADAHLPGGTRYNPGGPGVC